MLLNDDDDDILIYKTIINLSIYVHKSVSRTSHWGYHKSQFIRFMLRY